MRGLGRRVDRLEARMAPPKIFVVYADEPDPPDLPPNAILVELWGSRQWGKYGYDVATESDSSSGDDKESHA